MIWGENKFKGDKLGWNKSLLGVKLKKPKN